MQLQLEGANKDYQIQAYSDDSITINQTVFHNSILIIPNRGISPWPVTQLSDIDDTCLKPLQDANPEIIILGSGATTQFLTTKQFAALQQQGIGIECMATASACRTFNVLLAENRRVIAALIIEENKE